MPDTTTPTVVDQLGALSILDDLNGLLHGKGGPHKIGLGLDIVSRIAGDVAEVAALVPGAQPIAAAAAAASEGAAALERVAEGLEAAAVDVAGRGTVTGTIAALLLAGSLALSACGGTLGTTVSTVAADATTACSVVLQNGKIAQAIVKGGALDTVNSIVNDYAIPACATESAIAAIAGNPGTVAWLNQLAGGLGALAQAAKTS